MSADAFSRRVALGTYLCLALQEAWKAAQNGYLAVL